MLASVDLGTSLRIATVVVPVAVYFLILGVLNSRRHPQMLSGRLDFALMAAALAPVFVLPAVDYVGASLPAVLGVVLALTAVVLVLAPRRGNWVVYNLPSADAREAVTAALRRMGVGFRDEGADIRVGEGDELTIRSFSLLRNVSIRLRSDSAERIRNFERALGRTVHALEAQASPTGVSFLLAATALLVAPLSLVAHRVPEIVRILTDLL